MTSSSRSSMSSASARLYSFEQLLELGASSGAQSSTTASANLLQLGAQRFFADILVESDDSSSASSRASSRLSVHSQLSDDQDGEEEEDGWAYGEGELRTDLSAEAISQLRKAVHLALDNPSSYPAMSSSPLSTSSSKQPAAVLVSTNTANPNRLPLVYDNSSRGRFNQRRANPGGVFGKPRKSVPSSGCCDVQNSNTSNADRDSWRSSVFANRARRMEPQGPRASKEADSASWRRLERGAQWAWDDNTGYILVKD